MALDGIFLYKLAGELRQKLLGARVEKVYQPSKEEIVLAVSSRSFSGRLLLSAKGNSPRIHLTEHAPENPAVPPMFCMLLRKRITGARIADITQPGLERVLILHLDSVNELGDNVGYRLIIEIMSRHSNIIFTDDSGIVIDSVKRVDASESSVRTVLPGINYDYPPLQDKVDLTTHSPEDVLTYLEKAKDDDLPKALMSVLQGASPVVCRELSYLAARAEQPRSHELSEDNKDRLVFYLGRLKKSLNEYGEPTLLSDLNGKPFDFTYMDIHQYGISALVKRAESYSALLDSFYAERDRIERSRQKSQDLLRVLSNANDRISRKLGFQRKELKKCADREQLRIYGELINANMYCIKKGMSSFETVNYYDENGATVKIKLDPSLTPSQNSQKYYKAYRKAVTAEKYLKELIAKGEQELLYIDSVFDLLSRAHTERELGEIRAELTKSGYIRARGVKNGKRVKEPASLPPIEFCSSDGFKILVGRNNVQNDKLTLKTAQKNDLWFHTKDISGSHTIVVTNGAEVPDSTLEEAAAIAAYHSRADGMAKVAVDYTQVRYVKKPQGAAYGMVIYTNQHTVYVTPDKNKIESLAVSR